MLEARRNVSDLTVPTWTLALAQTAARGRRGRVWVMPKGNFAATLALPVAGGPAQGALRSFVAALALFDSFADVTGRTEGLALKWPNDVLLNGGKVAGILLETLPREGWLAVGIGVNLVAAPDAGAVEPGAVRPVSLSGETGIVVAPADFMTLVAANFDRWEAVMARDGFEPIRTAFLARAARVGQEITARLPNEELRGRFETIDVAGQLVLATDRGLRHIPAADIFFS